MKKLLQLNTLWNWYNTLVIQIIWLSAMSILVISIRKTTITTRDADIYRYFGMESRYSTFDKSISIINSLVSIVSISQISIFSFRSDTSSYIYIDVWKIEIIYDKKLSIDRNIDILFLIYRYLISIFDLATLSDIDF